MKKTLLPLFFLFNLSLAAQPSYVIDSLSLQQVGFDGGDCEFRFADVNDDGHVDIVSVGDHGSPFINSSQHGVMVYFGNGTGVGWNLVQDGNFGYGGVAVGDVNNDGFKDIGYGIHHNYASVDFGDQVLEVALGNGTGMSWTAWDDSLGMHGQTYGMFGTDFADVDNDGWLDVGSNSFGCCDGIHVYRNKGSGAWQHTFGFIGGNSFQQFQFADINNDGFMDFAGARQGGTVYMGDGTGSFSLADTGLPVSGIVGYYAVSAEDTDGDSLLELGFVNGGGVYVYKWDQSSFQWNNVSSGLPASGNYITMNLYDMDGDGIRDVVACRPGAVEVYIGNGSNNWTLTTTVNIPNQQGIRCVAIQDVDNSGRPDILLFGSYQLTIWTYENRLYLLREISSPANTNINAVRPGSGECLPAGSVRFIQWNTSVVGATVTRVTLELSTTGPAGPFFPLASMLPNNGTYQWQVPQGINSTNCVIRYSLLDSSGTSQFGSVLSPVFSTDCGGPVGLAGPAMTSFELYPNPATDELLLSSSSTGLPELDVYDMSGRAVLHLAGSKGKNFLRVDISGLGKGVYFIVGEKLPVRKFVKVD